MSNYIKNIWVDQEVERPRTYEMINNSDGSVTLVDSLGLVSELGTPVNADNMNHIEEGIERNDKRITILESEGERANTNLTNLTLEGEKHFLNKSQITNCILESPKMLDLKLADGTLTLKAGSKVIAPYGISAPELTVGDSLNGGKIADISWDESKLFYILQYNQDIQSSQQGDSYNRTIFLNANGEVNSLMNDYIFSGSTAPTSFYAGYAVWYDTANNLVKMTADSGATWTAYYSLPFALGSNDASGWSKIAQVFESTGYIGSTIWVNKGVKGLIPNGRGEDGSLKNEEVQVQYINTLDYSGTCDQLYAGLLSTGKLTLNGERKYDQESNILYNGTHIVPYCEIATMKKTVEQSFSHFSAKSVFNVVDRNSMLVGEIPVLVESYKNGSSWYRVYSDGWCEQGGAWNGTVNIPAGQANSSITVHFLKKMNDMEYYGNAVCAEIYCAPIGYYRAKANCVFVWGGYANSARMLKKFYWAVKGYLAEEAY